ncbi:MAG: hypothetical protein IPK19_10965 [Chloroflexi bacterium]|nr:hypothetical protein [Chloroflexota bacterium]
MAAPFKLSILVGDDPGRPPAEVAKGFEQAEIAAGLQLIPLESNEAWTKKQEEIASWGTPPIRISSHYLEGLPGQQLTGPHADLELQQFYTKRLFSRLADVGVKTIGIGAWCFPVVDGFSKTKTMDQAISYCNFIADQASVHGMVIALEPQALLDSLFPRYLDGLAFAKEVARPEVRVMADLAYFIKLDQPLEHILQSPEYCMHCHMAGANDGQPGVGDMVEIHTHLFRVLRDAGYDKAVSCACPWVSTDGGPLNFGKETAKSLRYLQDLREKVYAS